jgi:hypothetical protein
MKTKIFLISLIALIAMCLNAQTLWRWKNVLKIDSICPTDSIDLIFNFSSESGPLLISLGEEFLMYKEKGNNPTMMRKIYSNGDFQDNAMGFKIRIRIIKGKSGKYYYGEYLWEEKTIKDSFLILERRNPELWNTNEETSFIKIIKREYSWSLKDSSEKLTKIEYFIE